MPSEIYMTLVCSQEVGVIGVDQSSDCLSVQQIGVSTKLALSLTLQQWEMSFPHLHSVFSKTALLCTLALV